MFFQNLIAPAISLALAVQAVPLSDAVDTSGSTVVEKRDLPNAPPLSAPKVNVANLDNVQRSTACDGNKYDFRDLRDAVQRGQQYIDAATVAYAGSVDPALASNGYPHNFYNSQGGFAIIAPAAGCGAGQQLEFPILTVNGNVRRVAAGPAPSKDMFGPGPDRVIFTYVGGALNYCGIVTHSGLQGNAFKVCK